MTLNEMLKNDREKIDNVALSINRKEMEYMNYIYTHKYNVKYAFIKYGELLINTIIGEDASYEEFDRIYELLEERVAHHDDSKLTRFEFDAYRQHFFPIEEENDFANSKTFDDALWMHYRRNDHHFEYWDSRKIPNEVVIEICLDWIAMGMNDNSNSKAYDYYKENKSKFFIYPYSREKFEKLLLAVKKYDEELGDV